MDLKKEFEKKMEVTWEQDRSTGFYTVFINGEELDSQFSSIADRDKAISRIKNNLDWK